MKLKTTIIICLIILIFRFIEFNNRDHHRTKCDPHLKTVSKCIEVDTSQKALKAEQIASANLTIHEKVELKNENDKGRVEKAIVTKNIASLVNEQYDGQEVYKVTYNSKRQDLLGNIVIYVDEKTFEVIGRGIRE